MTCLATINTLLHDEIPYEVAVADQHSVPATKGMLARTTALPGPDAVLYHLLLHATSTALRISTLMDKQTLSRSSTVGWSCFFTD